MTNQIMRISERIKKYREKEKFSVEQIAQRLGISEAEYMKYEDISYDIPIGVIYNLSAVLGIDPTLLLTGNNPESTDYVISYKGAGVEVQRQSGYRFTSLAHEFKGRTMDPMIVTIEKNTPESKLVSHSGQEFNFCLEGTMIVCFEGKQVELSEGDSIYFDGNLPHWEIAKTDTARFLVILNENE